MTCQTINSVHWKNLLYTEHSSDLSLCDYHLFRSLQNSSEKQRFQAKGKKGGGDYVFFKLRETVSRDRYALHLSHLAEKNLEKRPYTYHERYYQC